MARPCSKSTLKKRVLSKMNSAKTFNPTPISKFLMTIFLGFNLTATINEYSQLFVVIFITVFFALNNKVKTAVKTIVFYGVVVFLLRYTSRLDFAFVKNYVLTFIIMIKIFFLPFTAGKFLIATSDVSSLIVAFEKMHFPKVLIIPIAVMFRYFPAFKDDNTNIKMAMKMRGITFRNPIKYLEYVSVPLLISAINIADDISKSAETKCIADPCAKTRYREVKFGLADIVYTVGIVTFIIVGRLYA